MTDPAERHDPLVGTVLGRYCILAHIGSGGAGNVYLAEHVGIARKVAIKLLRQDVVAIHPEAIERFRREATAASAIGNHHIVDVFDFFDTGDGRAALVMEYLEGRSLAAVIEDGPLRVGRAIGIAVQIARAMAAAHDVGIVHRDLKPENIFLLEWDDHPDFVKVLDFGIAGEMAHSARSGEARLTQAGIAFGTAEFMAPEQVACVPDVDGRADIFALGAVLYLMLTGLLPHDGPTALEIVWSKFGKVPELPSTRLRTVAIPSELDALILEMMAVDRRHRPSSMADVVGRLVAIEKHMARASEPPAHEETPASAASPDGGEEDEDDLVPGGRRSPVRWLVAAGFACAVAAGAYLALRAKEPTPVAVSPAPSAQMTASAAEAPPPELQTAGAPLDASPPALAAVAHPDAGMAARPPPIGVKHKPRATVEVAKEAAEAPAGPSGAEWLRLGEIHRAGGRLRDAQAAYFRASTSADRAAARAATLGLAELALDARHYREATRFARRALAAGADASQAWSIIAAASCALGEREEAEAAAQKLAAAGGAKRACQP